MGDCSCLDWRDFTHSPLCKKCGGTGTVGGHLPKEKPKVITKPSSEHKFALNLIEELANGSDDKTLALIHTIAKKALKGDI